MNEGFCLYSWFYPYDVALYIVLKSDSGKYISKTFEKKGCFYNFMRKHGLWNDESKELARFIWG